MELEQGEGQRLQHVDRVFGLAPLGLHPSMIRQVSASDAAHEVLPTQEARSDWPSSPGNVPHRLDDATQVIVVEVGPGR
jgi:hypothetical protein